MTSKIGVMVCGHGSRSQPAVDEFAVVAERLRGVFPDWPVEYGRDLGVDPKMVAAAADRVREAIAQANAEQGQVPLHDTCLVVIGRGASDPDANANVAKITRLLWEGFGFGWAETGYSGVTFPLVEPCLERVVRLGFRRVIVFPYFLFTGVLVDRIYGFTAWWPGGTLRCSSSGPGISTTTRRSSPPSPSGCAKSSTGRTR